MRKKKILITGGRGFIGKNILASFLSQKYDFLSPPRSELDLLDANSVKFFFEQNSIDLVIHSAVKPGHRNAKDPHGLLYANSMMFFNLMKYEHLWQKMLFIGSGSIYDMRSYQPQMREEYYGTSIPVDEHGFSKYIARQVIDRSEKIVDLVVFSIYGKYEDYAIRFISNLMCKCLFDLPLTMKQNRRFDFLWVDDLMPILEHFIEHPHQHSSYNVTPDQTIDLLGLAEQIRAVAGKEHLPILVKEEGMDREYSGSNVRLKKEMPLYQPTPFKIALPKLYQWYQQNQHLILKELLLVDK